ncbi:IS1 family transposase, partial [Escherichia coli]|nr:IS1 family transposase [Escherichia coli]
MASVSFSWHFCSSTDGAVRNGKRHAGHMRYLCSHCRKTRTLQCSSPAFLAGTHPKAIQ